MAKYVVPIVLLSGKQNLTPKLSSFNICVKAGKQFMSLELFLLLFSAHMLLFGLIFWSSGDNISLNNAKI